jgi:ABC-type transport system involved in multi-copper enzyme maturation permease subunit
MSACGIVFGYPKVLELMPLVPAVDTGGALGRRIREAADLSRNYRGYVWLQWFSENLPQAATLFAALLGTGGLLSRSAGTGVLFTLSLPASRRRIVGVRAATGLAELFVLIAVSTLVLPLLSPAIGQRYSLADAAVHGACAFIVGTVFFSLAFLLSTIFSDLWRPLLLACAVAVVLAIAEQLFRDVAPYGVYGAMSGERYFRTGGVPWLGLLASAAASAALLTAATRNVERQDF